MGFARVKQVVQQVVVAAGLSASVTVMGVSATWAAAPASDGWVLQWSAGTSESSRQSQLATLGYQEKRYYPLSNVSWVAALADTAAAPDTRFSPNYIKVAFETLPNDPQFTNTAVADDLSLKFVNLPTAWDYNQGSGGIKIGVLDSGIDTGHLDLKNKIDTAVSFVTGDADPIDKNGHGTNVSSLIAAEANNAMGIAGVCWGCKIVSVKVLGAGGSGTSADFAEGLRWAAHYGVNIINMSLGVANSGKNSNYNDPVEKAAIQAAYDQGILLFAASGNENVDAVDYPARYDQVVAVGAIDPSDGTRWTDPLVTTSGSNYKDGLELTAPGVSMFGDVLGGDSNALIGTGTSFASPIAAGVAGLVWSEQPTLTRDEVRNRLNSTTKDLNTPGWDEQTGFGCVDAAAALRVASFQVKEGKDVVSYPNPFQVRAGGTITIRPPQDVGALTVKLYSLDGRELRTLTGDNAVTWDGRTSGGQTVSAGVYLYQASASNLRDEGRITVIDW